MKPFNMLNNLEDIMSRPTRGAWIETDEKSEEEKAELVAPHTGRVD